MTGASATTMIIIKPSFLGKVVGEVVKLLLGMFMSHSRVSGFRSQLHFGFHFPTSA